MPTAEEKLLTELGLELLQGEKHVSVKRIVKRKQKTDGQRLAPGDKIVAVWGQMTAYMDTGEVSELLLASGEVKITVEKTFEPVLASSKASFFGLIPPNYKKIIGAVLKLRREGVVLLKTFTDGPFENCGIMEGDLVERINGRNVRYMPMSQIFEFIRKNQREKVELVVYRDVTVWG
ncbi:MAG: hypothetical protein HQ594_05145 [Candidatus Omnitrophica bacterium]|nr:hypothetical protein [Candidatus Omnitrophota bacterium]